MYGRVHLFHIADLCKLQFITYSACLKRKYSKMLIYSGYNDIGYNNPEVKTPVMDKLATHNGRILTQHYMQPVCTP